MPEISNVYLIKDLAHLTGYSIYTIKYYLKIGLITEVSRSSETKYRYFDDSTVEVLKKIRVLRREGKSISQIKKTGTVLLREPSPLENELL